MITENHLEIAPAYGRDYKSAEAASEAFLSGKDFRMMSIGYGGVYCSVRDFAKDVEVLVRYNRLESVVLVKVK